MAGAALSCLGAFGALFLGMIFLLGAALMAKMFAGAKRARQIATNQTNQTIKRQASSVKLGRAAASRRPGSNWHDYGTTISEIVYVRESTN